MKKVCLVNVYIYTNALNFADQLSGSLSRERGTSETFRYCHIKCGTNLDTGEYIVFEDFIGVEFTKYIYLIWQLKDLLNFRGNLIWQIALFL